MVTPPMPEPTSTYQNGFTEATVKYLADALARIEKKLDDLPCSTHGEKLARFEEKICNIDENKLSWKEIIYIIAAPVLISVLTTFIVGKM